MKCLVSASDGERYSVCPNDEFYVCGFRAFAKNIWRFLANGMGASGVNHRHDDKVNTAETPLIFLSTVHTLYCFCYSLISHTYLWEISLHPPPRLSLPPPLSHTHTESWSEAEWSADSTGLWKQAAQRSMGTSWWGTSRLRSFKILNFHIWSSIIVRYVHTFSFVYVLHQVMEALCVLLVCLSVCVSSPSCV